MPSAQCLATRWVTSGEIVLKLCCLRLIYDIRFQSEFYVIKRFRVKVDPSSNPARLLKKSSPRKAGLPSGGVVGPTPILLAAKREALSMVSACSGVEPIPCFEDTHVQVQGHSHRLP